MKHFKQSRRSFLGRALPVALIGGIVPALLTSCGPAVGEQSAKAKVWPVAQPKAGEQVATFAAGCFWSMEAIFKQLKGVSKVEPGYAGGKIANPTYEQVSAQDTGHAETVNILFDPKVITYRDLVEVLLTVRDPTTLDRQGPDEGPEYRSVIFTRNESQKQDAEAVMKQIAAARIWKSPIVTKIEPFKAFYRAEDYHLDYYNLHPTQGYCANVIAPEIEDFHAKFKAKLK